MTSHDGIIAAFTEDQVERLTGLSKHQLRHWDRSGFFTPSMASENRRDAYSRIYSFVDIAELRVLNVLRNQYGVSLQHLRQVSEKLAALDSGGWARTILYVLKRKVIFDDPESGKKREIVSGQYALGIPLEQILSDTKRDVQELSRRQEEQIGRQEQHRFVAHNAPVVSGTRIPVATIIRFLEDGYSPQDIVKEYPSLTVADVEAIKKTHDGGLAA